MAEIFTHVTEVDLLRLPPMIIGKIRWRKYIGLPQGDYCNGFNIRVEEHTATQFRALPGGDYEPIPGTGIWKDIVDALSCRALPDDGDDHVLPFRSLDDRFISMRFPTACTASPPLCADAGAPRSWFLQRVTATSSRSAHLSSSRRTTRSRASNSESCNDGGCRAPD